MNRLTINRDNKPIYDITYNSSFDGLAEFVKEFDPNKEKKICIVSDSHVSSLYLESVKTAISNWTGKVVSYVFPEGEASKTLNTVHDLYVKLIEERFDRRDLLLALGGGVVGDLTGFSAATYLRGIRFIQVPTSLLADVDSSIGGKTGVDFDSYKNMVGAFHMPDLVYINLKTLESLEERQFYSGMGEVVKSALIRDAAFFEWLEENVNNLKTLDINVLQDMVYKCNIVKKNVVENDPTEKGERALLNFGHTLGHAIEKYMNFDFLHGECVSIGCILASIISVNKGYISEEDLARIVKQISAYHLPTLPADLDYDKIIMYTKNDKKVVGSKIKFVLLDKIGNAFITMDVTDDDMRCALKTYMETYNGR